MRIYHQEAGRRSSTPDDSFNKRQKCRGLSSRSFTLWETLSLSLLLYVEWGLALKNAKINDKRFSNFWVAEEMKPVVIVKNFASNKGWNSKVQELFHPPYSTWSLLPISPSRRRRRHYRRKSLVNSLNPRRSSWVRVSDGDGNYIR